MNPPATLTPVQRLTLSRARLRSVLLEAQAPPASASPWHQAAPMAAQWLDSLKTLPGGSLLVEAVERWWAQHPLRNASVLAGGAIKAVLQPIAQRNPLGFATGALVLGALVAWTRPWRWAPRHNLLAGLGPALVSSAMAHLPMQAWLSALLSSLTPPAATTAPATPTSAAAPSTAQAPDAATAPAASGGPFF